MEHKDVKIDYRHSRTTLSTLRQFYTEEKYWDVQIQVDAKLFKCQRLLLAANLEYFDTIFSSNNFKESDATKDQPIILYGMDATAFEEILHFIYTGEILINDSNVLQLLFTSDFLRLRNAFVKERCVKYVKRRSQHPEPISSDNVFELFSFACLKAENILVDSLSTHICEHFYHFSLETQLMEVTFECLNTLIKFGKNYILPWYGSHDVILKVILNWVNHDRKERRKYLFQLMKNINFSYISSNYTLSIINTLENVVDEVLNPSEDKEFTLAQMEILKRGVEIGQTDGDNRLSATITLDVKDLSEIQINEWVFSSSSIIRNLSWKIGIAHLHEKNLKNYEREPRIYPLPENLSVYLFCDGTSQVTEWNCYASASFFIGSQMKEEENRFCKKFPRCLLFSSKEKPSYWGFSKFIRWNNLFDETNGYTNDKSLTLYADVVADLPFCSNQKN